MAVQVTGILYRPQAEEAGIWALFPATAWKLSIAMAGPAAMAEPPWPIMLRQTVFWILYEKLRMYAPLLTTLTKHMRFGGGGRVGPVNGGQVPLWCGGCQVPVGGAQLPF